MSELQYPSVEHILKTTKIEDAPMAKAFLETLMWLDQKAPKKFDGLKGDFHFDISLYINKKFEISEKTEQYEECGTVCCIAGAVTLYQCGGNVRQARNFSIENYTDMDPSLRRLFFPSTDKKPVTAARALRHYLFTGNVSWSVKVGTTYDV